MTPSLRVSNCGAGVQSSCIALMACDGLIEPPDYFIYADTGYESSATNAHFEWLKGVVEAAGIPMLTVSAGNIRDDVLNAVDNADIKTGRIGQPPFFCKALHQTPIYEWNEDTGDEEIVGYTDEPQQTEGKLWRKCTSEYKILPIQRKYRELLGVAKGERVPKGTVVEQWIGISLDEVTRMKPAREKWIETRWPLIELKMTRWDCIQWCKAHGYPEPPKSSCLCCPFHDNAYWRDIRDNDPDGWADVVAFERELHKGLLLGVKSKAYLHRSCVPIDEVDLDDDIARGQDVFSFWTPECEGVCGV